MSERGDIEAQKIAQVAAQSGFIYHSNPVSGGRALARSICEHLDIDWSMVFHVSTIMEQNGVDVPLEYDTIAKGRNVDVGHALATLLEAAGIER